MDGLLIVAAVLVVVLLLVTAAYNGLATLRQDVRDAWGSMDAQLRRRYDLLPPLVSLARATGEPAPAALTAALTAKNQAAVAFNPQQLAQAEGALTAHLRDLFAQPPEALAARPAFARSRADLLAVQADIERAIRRYNDVVESYSTALCSFPHDIVGRALGFTAQPVFELPDGPRRPAAPL